MAQNDHVFYRSQRKELALIERGKGIYLYDKNGKRYIDGSSGAVISNIGHAVSPIIKAMQEQAEKVEFVHGTVFKSEKAIELASRIIELCPGDLDKAYLVSGGSEAIETALKMTRSYHVARGKTQKSVIVSRWQSYHGATMGALSMGGRTMSRRLYQPYLSDFPHISPAYCYRCPYGQQPSDCDCPCAWELEAAINQVGAEYIAAFIAEPIVGATLTAASPPSQYFPIIRQICDKYDILFIADEVMTGFGRTGKNFGIEHWGIVPDILVSGKGLGAGYYPLAAAICSGKVYAAFQDILGKFAHGFTYQGNPLAAAVGLSVLDYIEDNGLIKHVAHEGEYLLEKLSGLSQFDMVGDVRGKGFMTGVELVTDKHTKRPFPPDEKVTKRVAEAAWNRGLIIYPDESNGQVQGVAGDGFMVAPPFITTKEEITEIVRILEESIDEVGQTLGANR
ncbi:MAG: aspartate aminotransferase family protein [Planctomycetes bacterium]|nr:aspartate aminotransferase family protein [Planctomycetota bacterium]